MSLVLDFVKKEASGTGHVSVRLQGSADLFFLTDHISFELCIKPCYFTDVEHTFC